MRWMLAMLVFVPISIAVHFLVGDSSAWMFVVAGLAIVPLAGFMGTATEELAKYRGSAIGGLLNATFGNATELIISIVAVQNNQIEVVKASLVGSIVGNVLLVLGLAIFLGGLKFKLQCFSKDMAGVHAVMLAMGVVSLLVPALFVRNVPGLVENVADPRVAHLSVGVAIVLMSLYFGSLIFAFRTHQSLFREGEEETAEPAVWSQRVAMLVLLASTIVIAVESELLVHSIEPVVARWHLSKLFIGVIVVPIVGNAAEHSTAVQMALRDKMAISFNIAVSSGIQIAMFVAPFIIFISPWMGHPVSILFSNFELVALTVAVFIAGLIVRDGKTHWLEGAQLLAVYIILALAFFYITQ